MQLKRVRVAEQPAAIVALLFGLIAALSPASPTGGSVADSIVVIAAVATTAWLAASAPWWALAAAGAVATLSGFGPLPIAFALLGAVVAFGIGFTRTDISLARTASAGCTLVALCNLGLDGFFGATTMIGIGCGSLLAGTGIARRKRRVRMWVRRGAIGVAVFAGLATVGAGASLAGARGDLVDGRESFETGASQLRRGETAAAATEFARAADAFAAAERGIGRPWAQPGRLIPIVGQHRVAGEAAARSGAAASTDIAALARILDVELLRPDAGRFDVDAISLLGAPFDTAYQTLLSVGTDLDRAQSSWLIGPVQDDLSVARTEFAENISTFDTLNTVVNRVPVLLGADEPRRYFVAFTTPAEARGTGGFMGNFAVLTADRGLVTLSNFGRTLDLNRGFDDRTVNAPDDWLRRWGRFGFTNGPDGTTGREPWSTVTISPNFPSTAAVISSLFPQSGGSEVDGVFAIDPYVLQAFVGFSGPVAVDGFDVQLTKDNTADFLLFDQYAVDDDERIDALEQVATRTINELLGGALPEPTTVADQLGPLVEAERLVAWMADPADQAVIEAIGMSGALPALDGNDDGFSVVVNNGGANKLDAFLTRSFAYDAVYSETVDEDGSVGVSVDGALSISLTNSAPTTGLPDGVIGNYVGDPVGTNRSLITVYTAAPVSSVSVNGTEALTEAGTEAGWFLTTFFVTTPSSGQTDIVVQIAGSLQGTAELSRPIDSENTNTRRLIVRTQPLVDDPSYEISTRDAGGLEVVDFAGKVLGTQSWIMSDTP